MSAGQYTVDVLSVDGITVVDLEGDIDFESGASEFKAVMSREIDAGEHHLVVDLTRVDLMDSTGLGVLVRSEQRLRRLGGSLAVICTDRLRRIFTITGLCDVMGIHGARSEALQEARRSKDAAGAPPVA